jgi:fumarylacetoacetase
MNDIDATHDPAARSWVESANGHAEFPLQNLPLGVFSVDGDAPRGGIAIGDHIFDLKAAAALGLLTADAARAAQAASAPALNALLALGAGPRRALRRQVFALLEVNSQHRLQATALLREMKSAVLHKPANIGDYTDFYSGIHHAENAGRLFRPNEPLLPNYKYVPIGYHGRASSVQLSGTPVRRPRGQSRMPDLPGPEFGPSQKLDFELEMGIWVGPGNALGVPIPIGEADAHIAGLCLLNDWSARDLQAWEYQPLGPFLGKSFLTTLSPWIVTREALAPFRIAQPRRADTDPAPLAYLWDDQDQRAGAFSIELQAFISTAQMRQAGLPAHRLCRSFAAVMYWTAAQLITHHSSNGCNLNPGDLLGTGTLSTPMPDGCGSLLEISRAGSVPFTLPGGETRTYLRDGDEISFAATARAPDRISIGFGPCRGTVVGATAWQAA